MSPTPKNVFRKITKTNNSNDSVSILAKRDDYNKRRETKPILLTMTGHTMVFVRGFHGL